MAKLSRSLQIYGHIRAITIHMKKQWTRVVDKRSSSGHEGSRSFAPETVNDHQLFKISAWRQIRGVPFLVLLSVPLIYAWVVPFLLLDLSVAIHQSVCFPIYGIPRVRRRDYLIFDRGRLAYLNGIEKSDVSIVPMPTAYWHILLKLRREPNSTSVRSSMHIPWCNRTPDTIMFFSTETRKAIGPNPEWVPGPMPISQGGRSDVKSESQKSCDDRPRGLPIGNS